MLLYCVQTKLIILVFSVMVSITAAAAEVKD